MKILLGDYEMEIVHHNPRIYTVLGVMTPEECKHFQEISTDFMKRSTVSAVNSKDKKIGKIDQRRTSRNCWVRHDHSEITLSVALRISKLVQMPLENAESFQVLHYKENEEYQPHMDTFESDTKLGKAYLGASGQRLITVLGYLNNVAKGGETSFPNIGKKVEPEQGKLTVFHDCHEGTNNPNIGSLHGACPVLFGEKWAFNLWYREHKTQQEH